MTIFTPFQILSLPNQGEWDYWGMQHTWERHYFGREPNGKRMLRRYRRRWKHYINMDLREIEFEAVD
jgi:hypothetical protein